jgi:Thioesterase-like superfamily
VPPPSVCAVPTAFFATTDAGLVPHPDARSPWSADMLHGRLLAGLAAWAIERDHGEPDLQPTRLTVDLFRSPAMAPAEVATTLVRTGGRVRVADAALRVGGVDVARASCLFLRRSPDGGDGGDDAPRTPAWDAPAPEGQPPTEMPNEVPFDVRPAGDHGFAAPGGAERRVWLRDLRPLVEGGGLSPFVRAALTSDFASPLANMASTGLSFINADLTLHLARPPEGEWLGLATGDRVTVDGVSVAQCLLHDRRGPVGWSSVSAVHYPRMDG